MALLRRHLVGKEAIWQSMTKSTKYDKVDPNLKELEHQYQCSAWSRRLSPDDLLSAHMEKINEESDKTRKSVSCELGVSYGPSPRQILDIFGASTLPKDAPVLLYIHGGYWQMMSAAEYDYVAGHLVAAGVLTISMDYDLAPAVKVHDIIEQARRALRYVLDYATKRGSRAVYIAGHSAGGHLTAMTMAEDWQKYPDVNIGLVKGIFPTSGVFDLRPVVPTTNNDLLGMTEDEAYENSPMKHLEMIRKNCAYVPALVAVGGDESPEFLRQSKEFHQGLSEGGVKSEYVELEGYDHFNLVEDFCKRDFLLIKKFLHGMGLSP